MRQGAIYTLTTQQSSETQALLPSEGLHSNGYETLAGREDNHTEGQENPYSPRNEPEEEEFYAGDDLLLGQGHKKEHHHDWKGQLKLALGFASGILATLAWSHTPAYFSATFTPTLLTTSTVSTVVTTSTTPRSLSSLGRTVHFEGTYYYVPTKPKATFPVKKAPSTWSESSLFPLTVIPSSEQAFGEAHIDKVAASYAAQDDVWSPGFMENVFLHYNGTSNYAYLDSSISYSNSSFLVSGYTARKAPKAISVSGMEAIPAGPYFATLSGNTVAVYEAWRLYGDSERAFYYGMVPHHTDQTSFQVLSASLPESNGVAAIGVPSRLYYTKTADKPLAGVRVSVKDLYDIKGLKTSMSSRAWLSLYPAATQTAPSIQRLIDLGAIIVGKTRLSQFGDGEYGTADSVDFSTPFNIRGDNYQDPSSSSSGAGAAAGAYGFVDLHVGSDTGGSVRAPAAINGVYGNRPSQGAVDMTGALPLSPEMDTAALLGLDPKQFAEQAKLFYAGNSTFRSYPAFPRKLLYLIDPDPSFNEPSPGFFPAHNPDAAPIYEEFVQLLEAFLGTRRVEVDFYAKFYERFGAFPPEYIGPAWSLLTAYEQWELVGKPFEADYAAANNGDRPFVDPPVRANWEHAKHLTENDRQFYLDRKQRFTEFISDELMKKNSARTCSNALTVFPLVGGRASYKSDYHLATKAYQGFNRFGIAQLGQVPEVVIPLADVPYFSKLTQTTKYLPVSISIQAAHGCDFVLYDLIIALADAGIIKSCTPGTARTFA